MRDFYVFTDFETTGFNIKDEDVPIEIGMVLTDDEYNILDVMSCYIKSIDEEKKIWEGEEHDAFMVHAITVNTILELGIEPVEVVSKINMFLDKHAELIQKHHRFIIMSDNAQMEYNCMWKLYQLANARHTFPFHYSAWDINMLINSVQKVEKGKSSHSALQDAFRMYKATIRALERTNFRKWQK